MSRIRILIFDKSLIRLFIRINEFVLSKSYSCRNLINIYYDYSHLGRRSDEIAKEILQEIRLDPKILTTFSCIQIVQSIAHKDIISAQDSRLLTEVLKILPEFDQDFDIEQKSTIFKYLAQIQLQHQAPRYQSPPYLVKLKNQLKEKIEHMSEFAVTNVLFAYEHLPREFGDDLLEEIKEMVCVTLKHDPQNIKSFFLTDVYESLSNLKYKKRKLQLEKMDVLNQEIYARLKKEDPEITRVRSLVTLIESFEKNNNLEGVKAIYDYVLLKKDVLKNALLDNFLISFAKKELDVTPFIDLVISILNSLKTNNLKLI